jgi:hypothetical protein
MLMIVLAGSNVLSGTVDSTGVSSASLIRSQLRSIANEVVDSTTFDVNGRVAVQVGGEGQRMLAENAFIEVLQKRNFVSVVVDTAFTNQILSVFIFQPEIKVRELDAKLSERTIRTILEAKVLKGSNHEVRMLGTFQRETIDTAQVFSTGVLPAVQQNENAGVFQRMLTPFIVVGGVIVIVYLFFTVRS